MMSEAELKLLQALIYEECGMFFDERRSHFLEDRLQRRLRARGIPSFYQYYRLLTSASGREELAELVEILTINETSFFRNKPQLELFQKNVLDTLLRRKHSEQDYTLRIWSAGCSTGQEPFTLAMLMCDALSYYHLRCPQPPTTSRNLVPLPWRAEILASDISYSALRSAQQAAYTEMQMEGVDCMYRLRYFDRIAGHHVVKKAVQDLVHFDFHNLKSEYLPQHNDVIFCRNVMIYFDEAEQKRLVEKLFRCLNPGGYLFIGHAETLYGVSTRFRMLHENHGTAYQRLEVTS
jgi:chemotaxis protein methyltransferase CheR